MHNIANYIKRGKLWEAFDSDEQVVLLIDEVDKADIEFPNDLLVELDRMEFFVYETGQTIKARHRPIIIITSNNEKELPDAFLRRCFFHFINFPDRETMREIIGVHYPDITKKLVQEANIDAQMPDYQKVPAKGAGPDAVFPVSFVGRGGDDTLFALKDGQVKFERWGRDRKRVSIV